MSSNPIIDNSIKQVRNAVYGKDVREAIARALEICYEGNSGDMAREMAQRAEAAAEAAEGIIEESRTNLEQLEENITNFDNLVVVSQNQPTASINKIWIQPQENQEYKVATFEAYEALWNRFNEITETYQQGHGGIVSILRDEEYEGVDDETEAPLNRYVVTYSDGTTGEFFMRDGQRGSVGPVDSIIRTKPWYMVQTPSQYTGIAPVYSADDSGWIDTIPPFGEGDYLWIVTVITYESGAEAYIYGLNRMAVNGRNGTGLVNSVSIGTDDNRIESDNEYHNVILPIDSTPTEGSGNLLTSGVIYQALQNATTSFENAELTGIPTAPTANNGTNTTQIATTEFVQTAVQNATGSFLISGIRIISITTSAAAVTYKSNWVNADTIAICCTSEPIQWTSSEGQIVFERGRSVSSTFAVLLVKPQ